MCAFFSIGKYGEKYMTDSEEKRTISVDVKQK